MEHVLGLEPCPLCIIQRCLVINGRTVALIASSYRYLAKARNGRNCC